MSEGVFFNNDINPGDTIRVLGYTSEAMRDIYALSAGIVVKVWNVDGMPCVLSALGVPKTGHGLIYELVSSKKIKKKPKRLGAFLREHGL